MDRFDRICHDIKEVRIQGAAAVARAAVQALLIRHDDASVKKLLSLRPTEPCMRNAIKFALSYPQIRQGVQEALKILNSDSEIAKIGSRLIENGMTVFTHCHSTTVMSILLEAKRQGKRFSVNCTETRPLFQGRITASQLAKAKIPTTLFVDSAARIALKKADIAFYGCDAITPTHIYNKIGSELFAIIAERYDVPVYVATGAWKFDPESIYGKETEVEERSPKEVWQNAPRGVKISNMAFEKVDAHLVTGIVSEIGVYMKKSFISAFKKEYPSLLK
jgi:ribose 1,5-bisphosphate isomerase